MQVSLTHYFYALHTCVSIYTHIYTHTYIYIHIYTHTYIHIHTYIYIYVCVYVNEHTHTDIYTANNLYIFHSHNPSADLSGFQWKGFASEEPLEDDLSHVVPQLQIELPAPRGEQTGLAD